MTTHTVQSVNLGLLSKLPPELREKIYQFHLVRPEPITMFPRMAPSFFAAHKAVCKARHYKHVRTGSLDCIDRTTGETRTLCCPSRLALLATSRVIYNEAVHIYYSKNHLVFENVERIAQFITSCQGRYHFMGEISFEYRSIYWSSEVFEALMHCQHLRAMHIRFHHKWIAYEEPLAQDAGIGCLCDLRGIKTLELSGKDYLDGDEGQAEEVDVDDPRAIGPTLRRELTRPREQTQIYGSPWVLSQF